MIRIYCTSDLEGYLSKKSIHINESFVHAIALALWLIDIPILLFTCEFVLLLHARIGMTIA